MYSLFRKDSFCKDTHNLSNNTYPIIIKVINDCEVWKEASICCKKMINKRATQYDVNEKS